MTLASRHPCCPRRQRQWCDVHACGRACACVRMRVRAGVGLVGLVRACTGRPTNLPQGTRRGQTTFPQGGRRGNHTNFHRGGAEGGSHFHRGAGGPHHSGGGTRNLRGEPIIAGGGPTTSTHIYIYIYIYIKSITVYQTSNIYIYIYIFTYN